MKLIHIKTEGAFNNAKFSSNERDNAYFMASDPKHAQSGIPTVLFTDLAFCRAKRIIYTHGAFYTTGSSSSDPSTDPTEGSYLKQVSNLSTYTGQEGEIVEYVGETDEFYTNGYIYRYTVSDKSVPINQITSSSNTNILQSGKVFYYEEESELYAYADSSYQYFCYDEPNVDTKVYKIGNPVQEYKITAFSPSPAGTGYLVNLKSLSSQDSPGQITLKRMSKKLWISSDGKSVYSLNTTFSGIVQTNGDTYVYITSSKIGDRTNYWKLILPDTVASGSGGFNKLIVGNSEINSYDQSTITLNAGTGINLENTSRGIIISRLTEINDSLTDSNYTWSSEKITQVISAINTSNFKVVDQLPTENIDTNVIYIVPKQGATSPDQKEEYIYVDGEWEHVGSFSVDLSDYYTRGEVDNKLDGKQNKLTAVGVVSIVDNNISVNLSAYYTSQQVEDRLNVKQDKINGSEGEVAYLSNTGIKAQTIMCDGYVVDTPDDLERCKDNKPSFEEVFNTWKRFAHLGSVDDYQKDKTLYPNSDYNKWTYIPSLDTVSQPNNSSAYTGFISPKSYSSYDITVRVYSDNGDDDFIGLVAAFAKDSNGKEHTLSFLRTARGTGINWTGHSWVCLLDFRGESASQRAADGAPGMHIIANKYNEFSTKDTNWASVNENGASNGGCVINMSRTGNIIKAKCSEFKTSTLISNSEIIVDLDDATLLTKYPNLSLFKGAAPWGYSTFSQANSRYQNISITDPNFMIFDLYNNKVWSFNSTTKDWDVKEGYTPIDSVGVGRFSYNSITDKLFYNDGSKITRVSTKLTAGNNINITNEGVISANINAAANNGRLTIKQGDTVLGSFDADQATNTTIQIPTPPVVNDGTLVIKQGGTNLGTFNANQSGTTNVDIPVPTPPNNGVLTIKKGGNSLGTFSANQAGNKEIEIPSTPANSYDIKDLADSTSLRQTWSGKQDPISGTGVISVINNVVSADLSNYDTTAQVNTKLATKQNTLTGNNGDVMYHNGTSIIPQQIMSGGYVVNTAEDLALCKNNTPSFETVFNTWRRFDTWGGRDNWGAYKKASGSYTPDDIAVEKWVYDSTLDRVRQPQNSTPYNGFISPESYSNYDIKVRLYSTNTYDDVIGLVAAFAKDSNGKIHTLSFLRSGGGIGSTGGVVYSWGCMLDYNDFNWGSANYNQVLLANNSSNSGYLPKTNPTANTLISGNSNAGWKGLGDGTVIRIVRTGNVFEAWCSEFNSPDLIEASKITIDLDALSSTYSVLNLFKGSSPWGYSTLSQADSMFENISITSSNLIYDLVNTVVWSYDPSQAAWVIVSGANPISAMGVGRLNYNSITGKLFYNNGSSIIELSASSSSITPANDSTISLTQGGNPVGSFTLNQVSGTTIDFPAPPTYTSGDAININSAQGNSVNVLYDNDSIILNGQGKLEAKHKIQQISESDYNSQSFTPDPNTLYLIVEV